MKKKFVTVFILLCATFVKAQNFEGSLLYECKTNIHISEEEKINFNNYNQKYKDSTHKVINDSTLLNRMQERGKNVDSIKIIFGKNRLRKTYIQKDKLEYIFDFEKAKKITHTPKYECIDTTDIKLVDYSNKVQVIESDSVFIVNGIECNKIIVKKSNYYFFDIYYTKSKYRNMADAFIFETNNNVLFQNLYFLKDKLTFKKIIKLKYYTSMDAVDWEYILKSTSEQEITEKDLALPKYEYCLWDILEDGKLRRKHRKRNRLEKKKNND